VVVGTAIVAVIGISEATLKPPEVYTNRFCLLDQGKRTCRFQTLTQCMTAMPTSDSECVRDTVKPSTLRSKIRRYCSGDPGAASPLRYACTRWL
jgi:hypothetical protein